MDMGYDQETFNCKLIATARSVDSNKNMSVYLILDATNVKAISLHSNSEVPPNIAKEFVKQARCTAAAELVSLQLTLTQNVPLVVPDLTLRYKLSTVKDIGTLLRLGRCEAFTVYVPLDSVNRECLATLCDTLDQRVVKSAERSINTLYAGAGHKIVMHIDELWSPNPPRSPPPYEPPTALGASNDKATSQSVPQFSNSSRATGKRRSISPDLQQIPSKRQSLTQKAALEPWQLAIAAQGAQLAALHAEISTLREDMQRFQRAPHADAGTQTDPVVEHGPELSPEADPADSTYVLHSQASTVEDTIDDRLTRLEENIMDEQILRERLDKKLNEKLNHNNKQVHEKLDHNNQQLRETLDLESSSLHHHIGNLNSQMDDLEYELQDNLREEFTEGIDKKGMDLQIKLEEFIERRLEDVEEVVKQDLSNALENGTCSIQLGWTE
ncbi:hypothetical protein E4T44_08402 [Aureobasidium sp. EXF-8845]|nr:hypothetical protein E4T44_08402 [Aureobasidium sp. EXF-8845]KAI4844045.1 hypothetical protein E4T45_08320 [Aureobasidium sp. EXF-8846]